MEELSRDRWRQLVEVREDLEQGEPALPARFSDVDGRRREASPRAIRFAQALAFDARWSGISNARHRHDDLAA